MLDMIFVDKILDKNHINYKVLKPLYFGLFAIFAGTISTTSKRNIGRCMTLLLLLSSAV